MKEWRRFLELPQAERTLLVESYLLMSAIRLGLRALSFATLRRCLALGAGPYRGCAEDVAQLSPHRIGQLVDVASRYVPAATCLAQALTAQVLLARRGCLGQLRIGVAKNQDRQLRAHAWLECDGEVVVGGSVSDDFRPLLSLEAP